MGGDVPGGDYTVDVDLGTHYLYNGDGAVASEDGVVLSDTIFTLKIRSIDSEITCGGTCRTC